MRAAPVLDLSIRYQCKNCKSTRRLFAQCSLCLDEFYKAYNIEYFSNSAARTFHINRTVATKETVVFSPGFHRPFDPQPLEAS